MKVLKKFLSSKFSNSEKKWKENVKTSFFHELDDEILGHSGHLLGLNPKELDLDVLKEQQVQISHDDLSRLTELLQTHPYLINRIQEIIRYSRSSEFMNLTSDIEGYDGVIYEDAGSNETKPGFYQEEQQDFCFECGENLATDVLICLNCGAIRKTEDES